MLMSPVGRGQGGAPGGLTPTFFSDWATVALGTSVASKGDDGKWGSLGGFGQEVVAGPAVDFPSAQCLKITANYSNSGFALNRTTGMSVPSAGTTRYYRWYVRMTFPDDLVGNGDHPWQDGNAVGDCNWICGVHYGSDSPGSHLADWQIGPTFLANTNGQFDNGPWLDKGTTYRVECALERIDATTYNFSIRVYASDSAGGALLYGPADFPADAGGGTVATRGPWTFRTVANLDGFNCGTNDFETAGNDWWDDPPYNGAFTYGYQGCVAIVDKVESIASGLWIGPYGTVTGEA